MNEIIQNKDKYLILGFKNLISGLYQLAKIEQLSLFSRELVQLPNNKINLDLVGEAFMDSLNLRKKELDGGKNRQQQKKKREKQN